MHGNDTEMPHGFLGRKSVGLQEALDPGPQRQPGTHGALSPTLMYDWLFLFHFLPSVRTALPALCRRQKTIPNSSQFYR